MCDRGEPQRIVKLDWSNYNIELQEIQYCQAQKFIPIQ